MVALNATLLAFTKEVKYTVSGKKWDQYFFRYNFDKV